MSFEIICFLSAITRKEEILIRAAALFRIKGYSATTMRDIARDVGMEAASLYNHISSKQLILSDLLMELAQLFTEGMETISHSPISDLEKLEELIKLHVDLTMSHTDAISLLPSEWVHLEEPQHKEFLILKDAYERKFKIIIAAVIAEGNQSDIDPDVTLFSILSTLRWLYSWQSKYKVEDIEKLKADLVQNLIYGLR